MINLKKEFYYQGGVGGGGWGAFENAFYIKRIRGVMTCQKLPPITIVWSHNMNVLFSCIIAQKYYKQNYEKIISFYLFENL